jgi:predicted ribosomally synthesized peptide with nif11-like leader
MSKMKELYEKVAKDSALQAKFAEIMKEAAEAGEATKEKLIAFAKEAGYEVSFDEAQEFFKALSEKKEGDLSDADLDMVAGGKCSTTMSVITLGTCHLASVVFTGSADSCHD